MDIAIITARGGSKRTPRKNIRDFCGKPMIAWPIEAAKSSGCFAHILVSTDDEEIAEISKQYGAEVPFLRPAELADDFTHAHVAARHALEWALATWGKIRAFCHIYPTAPFLTAAHIRQGKELIDQGAAMAMSALRIDFPVYQILERDGQGYKGLFSADKAFLRSQDMPDFFIDAGQMYWHESRSFFERGPVVDQHTRLVLLPKSAFCDIDTEEDWLFAEKLAKLQGEMERR